MIYQLTDSVGNMPVTYTFQLKNLLEVIDSRASIGVYLNRLDTIEYIAIRYGESPVKDAELVNLLKAWNDYLNNMGT